jgi:hypothetical protein
MVVFFTLSALSSWAICTATGGTRGEDVDGNLSGLGPSRTTGGSAGALSPPPRFLPPPDGALGLLWFGANASGPDGNEQLAFIQRHALAGYGWQHGTDRTERRHAETSMAQGVSRLAGVDTATATVQQRFVYRNMQTNWAIFDVMRAAARRVPSRGGMFLRDYDNSPNKPICRPHPSSSSTNTDELLTAHLVFKDTPSTGEYYVKQVVGELVAEADVSAAFFDETDWSACGYDYGSHTNCTSISNEFRVADLRAKLPTIRHSADMLNAAGIWPILSSKNVLTAAWHGLPPKSHRPCLLPHDDYFNAMRGAAYGRFYETWLGVSPDYDAAMVANALLEGAQGVGLVLRTAADASGACAGQRSTDKHVASARYGLAGALIVQTNYTYWGLSTGWYDEDWCWHADYDLGISCGHALSAARRNGAYVWQRSFEHCEVALDTKLTCGNVTRVP